MSLSELLAQRTYTGFQSQALERGGVQAMRNRMDISSKLAGRINQLLQLLFRGTRRIRQSFRSSFQSQGEECQPLTEIIVKLGCLSATLFLLCVNQCAAQLHLRISSV